eukprot:snap_masked-scaffold_6-processed-gene-15.53-mRNA-1 protein AED:1.00 eAED:1.00 QI:0/0/0/0/1/1/2/0/188
MSASKKFLTFTTGYTVFISIALPIFLLFATFLPVEEEKNFSTLTGHDSFIPGLFFGIIFLSLSLLPPGISVFKAFNKLEKNQFIVSITLTSVLNLVFAYFVFFILLTSRGFIKGNSYTVFAGLQEKKDEACDTDLEPVFVCEDNFSDIFDNFSFIFDIIIALSGFNGVGNPIASYFLIRSDFFWIGLT